MKENDLKILFDFQRFRKNKKLDAVISDTLGSKKELTADELTQVNAAGAIYNNGPSKASGPFCAGYCEYTDTSGETKQGKYVEFIGNRTDEEKEALARQWCEAQGFTFQRLI